MLRDHVGPPTAIRMVKKRLRFMSRGYEFRKAIQQPHLLNPEGAAFIILEPAHLAKAAVDVV